MGRSARAVVMAVTTMRRTVRRSSRVVRRVTMAVSLCGAIVLEARTAWSHPLHTTLTDVVIDPADGAMRLTIRAFADDFSAVVAKRAGKARPADYTVPAADVASYVASAVSVEDPSGRRAPLVWVGVRRTGDVMWVTMRVPSVHTLRGVKLASRLLFENFDDQVNIVQATYDGHRHSMLFTAGDGRTLRPIP
jgi:hypothetical protein